MKVKVFEDHQKLSAEVATSIITLVQRQPDAVFCLAAGDTPRLAYRLLVEQTRTAKIDFSRCTFVGLDEWIGIPPENEGSCAFFLKENLFRPLAVSPDHFHLFNALSDDLSLECRKMDAIIEKNKGIDMMLVGVGMNGHIGFNEPGSSERLYAHVVALDATTRSVGQKYFKQSAKLQYGITLGLRHLLESKTAIAIVSGIKKADVIRRGLEGPVTTELPVSIIRKHPEGIVMLDEEAASGLKGIKD